MTPPEDNMGQTSVSNNSKVGVSGNTYCYESGSFSKYNNLRGDESRKGTMINMSASPSNATNINVAKILQKQHQQSSVFLSPASDVSGSW